ncbi:TetR-like C-terminal domain-containing protein [Nakamurella lactea]|uniref:TetR-like C-terminal domain-containing protein n=1 Tax=Nakamurella lactea TaxID=459515 RepID=UPI00042345FF|nr:TetR-like C-terminal domain-containing protein [Nakamurella lactea]
MTAPNREDAAGTLPIVDKPAKQRAITAEIQTDLHIAEDLVRRLLRPQLGATADRIRVAVAAGEVDEAVDVEPAVELLFGPVFHRRILRTAELDEPFADGIVTLVLGGLRPR